MTDFDVRYDMIYLENAIFKAVGSSTKLSKAAFWASKSGKAHDYSDRIIYDTDGGQLYYDPDGAGRAAAVRVRSAQEGPQAERSRFPYHLIAELFPLTGKQLFSWMLQRARETRRISLSRVGEG